MSRCTKALDPFIRENESNKKHANDPLPRSAANPNGESSVDRDSRRLCPRAVPTEKKLNTFYRSTRGKWERREWRGGKKQVIQGGTRLEKWKGKGGERTRDCNLINPRLEVARRSGVRSTGSDRLETLARQAYEAVEERGRAHRRLMRPYSPLATPRPGWIFTRAHAFSLRLGFINRDRTPARIVSRFASFEICAAEVEEGGFVLGRVRERGGDRDRL